MSSGKWEDTIKVGSSVPTWNPEVGRRLREVVATVGGGAAAGEIAGVSDEMISRYINGKARPTFYALAALAKAANVSLDWIAGLDSSEKPTDSLSDIKQVRLTSSAKGAPVKPGIDPALMARVHDAIIRTHKAADIALQPMEAGAMTATYYERVAALVTDPGNEDERLALIDLLRVWLKKDIASAKYDPGNSKATA